MRPIKLELEGFTSFRNRVTLDFSPLDLFGITGPTGAGKSSLIDGLVYALYGRTPRLGDKSVSDLVSQGAQQLRVFLEFTAGNKRYRIARALKRGKSAKVQLEIHDGTDGWDAIAATPGEVKEQIPRIVGLDYEGFSKAVVLPQGRFDEFLRGKTDERRRILADLLNLKVYEDMKQRANSKAAELRQRIDLSEKHLANDYGDATLENQKELENHIKDDEGLEATLSKTWQQLAKALPVGLSLRQFHESQQIMHKDLKSSQQQLHQAKEEAATSAGKITELQARLVELDRKLVAVGYDEGLHLELKGLVPQAKARNDHSLKLQTTTAQLKKQGKELELAEVERQTAERVLEEAAKKSSLQKSTFENLSGELESLEQRHGSTDLILETARDLEQLEPRQVDKQRAEQRLELLRKQRAEMLAELPELERSYQEATSEAEASSSHYEHLLQLKAVERLRQHLTVGDPCPLCDQIVSRVPQGEPSAVLEEAKRLREEKNSILDARRKALEANSTALKALPDRVGAEERTLDALGKSLQRTLDRVERILEHAPNRSSAAELKALADSLHKRKTACQEIGKAFRLATEAESSARDSVNQKLNRCEMLNNSIKLLEEQVTELSDALTSLDKQLKDRGTLEELQSQERIQETARLQRDKLQRERAKEELAYKATEKVHRDAENKQTTFAERVRLTQSNIDTAASEIAKLQRKLEKLVAGLDLPAGSDAASQLESFRTRLEREREKLNSELSIKRTQLKSLIERIDKAAKMRHELEGLRHSAHLFSQLGALLRSDRFLRFILQETFARLAVDGTQQLRALSSGRYSFSAAEDEFYVLDHWNADEKRPVSTLSGGESFLASLSLALALAGSVQEYTADRGAFGLESLFLDEGFSTLDTETLNVVVEAIETLQTGGRLVGVISHVEELAERLPDRIRVVKSMAGSAIVTD